MELNAGQWNRKSQQNTHNAYNRNNPNSPFKHWSLGYIYIPKESFKWYHTNHKETNSNEVQHIYNKKRAGNSFDRGNALFYDQCDAKKKIDNRV